MQLDLAGSWDSQGKNTEVVCHSLLQWITFCQNSPSSPIHLGWPYMAPKNPMNSMKRQKDRTLKDELPRSVCAQYATGDQWRNNSRKNEEIEPKQKQHSVVDVTGDGTKV